MLTAILERNSWLICKIGTPLVFFYHVLISSTFFNTAAEDAKGLEKFANQVLIPWQYFFEGKLASLQTSPSGESFYLLERRFSYDSHFFIKIACSYALIPLSLPVGSVLKAFSYLSPNTIKRSEKICAAIRSRKVISNKPFYRSVGFEIGEWREAEMIDTPRYKKKNCVKNGLKEDIEALREISRILSDREIPFWIDCGTCLGCYQYGGVIPNDWDIDIGILRVDFDNVKNALQDLDSDKFVVQDWSGRAHPKSYLKVFVKETGALIDLYNFIIDKQEGTIRTFLSNEHNIFLPKSWKVREKRYCTPMPLSNVFPLKKALFEGIEVPVPGNISQYLQVFYGENLAPAKIYNEITGLYEKDPDHPYWLLPNVH